MKAHVKTILFILSVIFLSCSENENYKIEKTLAYDWPNGLVVPSMWSTTDGIKISKNDSCEMYFIDLDTPLDFEIKNTEIEMNYMLIVQDSILVHNKRVIDITNNKYPVYWVNSLNVLDAHFNSGIYFFTSFEDVNHGLEPINVTLWIYYQGETYRFSGIIPKHKDWDWNRNYKFFPDNKLKSKSLDIYNQGIEIWNSFIDKYKDKYNME